MNDQLKIALAESLGRTADAMSAGAMLLQEELPDVIQQLLLWKLVDRLVFGFFFLTAACAVGYLVSRAVRATDVGLWRGRLLGAVVWTNLASFTVVFGSMIVVFCSLGFLIGLHRVLQIWLAPKIYLIEYAVNLAKGG